MERRDDTHRGLGWKHGSLAVQQLGGMLGPVTFLLADGRQVSPLHVAPWAAEEGVSDLPGVMQSLRGEWPCVPFGYPEAMDDMPPDWGRHVVPADDELPHGFGSNRVWTWEQCDMRHLRLSIDYPASHPVRRLMRTIRPDPGAPAVDIGLRIETRFSCRLPIGLHPTFRLPSEPGAARLRPASFREGWTFPGTVSAYRHAFAIDGRFIDLAAVPSRSGGLRDATSLPFEEPVEDVLLLADIDGDVTLDNRTEGYRVRLSWDPAHFPSALLWYSLRGRTDAPWNGRNLALGIEPICSAFDLGTGMSTALNPLAASGTPTARAFGAGEVFSTYYRIEVEPLPGPSSTTASASISTA